MTPKRPPQKTFSILKCSNTAGWYMTVGKPWPTTSQAAAFENDEWELYHLEEDFNEVHNLAEVEPERLQYLQTLWWQQAKPIRCYR